MPWTVAHQVPLFMGLSRQKFWGGLPLPSPGDLPNPGIEPASPALAGRIFMIEPPGKPTLHIVDIFCFLVGGFPDGSAGKESACQCRRCRFDPWVGKIPWRRKWQPTPVLLPRESHGQRSLAGYSLWGHKESHDLATEQQQQRKIFN